MRRNISICLMTVLFCGGCQRADVELMQAQLKAADAQVAMLRAKTSNADDDAGKRLVHVVWFKMKQGATDTDHAGLIAELNKLSGIPVVRDLEVGRFQDLGDARAMSDLDLVMQMGFESVENYRTYQDHSIHLQLKKDIGQFLGGPPVTYDYWSE